MTIDLVSKDKIDSSNKSSFAISEDISICGIKILSETIFPIDSQLRIQLSLARAKKTVNMTGQVRWVKSLDEKLHEIGIEILDTSMENIKILFEYLYKNTNAKY